MLFKWVNGRQNTGYQKMLLCNISWPVKFDLYVLKFPTGSFIPSHTDPVESGKHYRVNLIINSASKGGEFLCDYVLYSSKYMNIFRPDLYKHEVTLVESGTRYVLSFGFIIQ